MLARIIIVTTLLIALPAIAADKGSDLTVYGGYRGGGSFTDANTGQSLKLESNGAAALALDFPYQGPGQYQVFVSRQHTSLMLDTTPSAGNRLPMDIYYFHFGGTYFFEGEVGKGTYVVGGLGATLFNPEQGYNSELYPSINIGFGFAWPLGKVFSVRAEARGYGTLVNRSGGVFCSGGCVVSIKGDTVTQGEMMLGLSVRF